MSLNQLTTNFIEAYKTNNIASTLFCLQPSHLTMTLDLKDTIIRSLITPQNYINGLSFPILCSSITDFSCIVIFSSIMYIILCQSYVNVICKLHACTFVTCSLNVIDKNNAASVGSATWTRWLSTKRTVDSSSSIWTVTVANVSIGSSTENKQITALCSASTL